MNKFTEKLFGKNVKVIVNFIDLDQNNEVLETSGELTGKAGSKIDYNPIDVVKELVNKGYELVDNEFISDNNSAVFGEEDKEYKITFRHQHVVVNAENPGFDFTKDDLEKEIKQIVHYTGATSRTPENSITSVKFSHSYEVDKVTQTVIEDKGWKPEKQNFMIIGTPTLPGFVPDKTAVGGDAVSAEDDDRNYDVNFEINKNPSSLTQTAVVKFVDIGNNNKLIKDDKLSGQPNTPIQYDPKAEIEKLEEDGYTLVHNGFNEAGDIQFFGNSDSYEPVFIITLKYTAIAVNSEHPNDNVDPSLYEKDSKFTVKLVGAGQENSKEKTQTAHWTRTITYLPSANRVIENGFYDTPWQADIDHFDDVEIPIIKGYHTDISKIKGMPVTKQDQIKTVSYHENGHIIPVDEAGNEIEGAPHPQFENDEHDPSKVNQEQIIPDVDGYHCDLMTIKPSDPSKDVTVEYKADKEDSTLFIKLGKDKEDKENKESKESKESSTATSSDKELDQPKNSEVFEEAEDQIDTAAEEDNSEVEQNTGKSESVNDNSEEQVASESNDDEDKYKLKDQVAIVNFIDIDHNGASLTSSGPLVGKPGDSINDLYSTEIPLKVIKKAGYHVVFNNFDSDGFVQRFDNNDLMTQVFSIGVSKKVKTKDELLQKHQLATTENKSKDDILSQVEALKATKDQLKKIRPTLVTKDNNSDTVTRLLDIITALLNIVFTMGNNKK